MVPPCLAEISWALHILQIGTKFTIPPVPTYKDSLLDRYGDMFEAGLGTSKGRKARIEVEPNAKPHYCKARTVPFALRQKVKEELERLVVEGTLEPIKQ